MRALFEVTQFEIRYQLRSPFFLGALLMFAMIHFMAITQTFIHIDSFSNQVAINSAYGILQIEQALFIFGMLPIVAVVTTAMTRDYEHATASLLFVTPISPKTFVLGRFLGALSVAVLIGLAGLLAAMIGTFMPWMDQERIAAFTLMPWAYVFFVIILPNTLILCAIFFSIAALTRSFALTFAAAMAFFVAEALLNIYARLENGTWAALADPSARLTVAAETRYWTVAELNTNLPIGLLSQNRLLWLTVALLTLLLALLRFHLDFAEQPPFRFKLRPRGAATARRTPQPAIQEITLVLSFSPRASLAQFVSQLKMDLSCVFKSPLVYIILALVVTSGISEFQNNLGLLKTPLYPLTSQMLPFLRFGMLPHILLVGLWYSAELIHRERAFGIGEIISASPFPDWLMILAKTTALCLVAGALMLVAVLSSMGLQAATGYTHFELGLYLQSAFIYNGVYYCMLCIVAVVIQAISPNKWLGLLSTLGVYIALLSLEPMGFDHVLYNFRIPLCRLFRPERLWPFHQTGVLADRLLGSFLRPAAHSRASALPARQLLYSA
jgi:ABC-type transport system involved in multi-copper enzyme maturation permease subunit